MCAYIYAAALWCETCALKVRAEIDATGDGPADPDDEYSYDSDEYPKGPYSDGGGEADTPQHCDGCGCFLENPLTSDGEEYVREAVADAIKRGRLDAVSVTEWAPFYGIDTDPDDKVRAEIDAAGDGPTDPDSLSWR